MKIPKEGDTVLRTADGTRFTVEKVVEAGGEDVYRLSGGIEVTGAMFVREHDETRAAYEVVA